MHTLDAVSCKHVLNAMSEQWIGCDINAYIECFTHAYIGCCISAYISCYVHAM